MKLPITDQFLWMVYDLYEATKEVLEPLEYFQFENIRKFPDVGWPFWKALKKKKRKQQFSQFIYYLKKNGYIKIANLKEKKGILLTPKGKKKVLKAKIKLGYKKRRKDKKWIMLMYDIPEKKRKGRDLLREILRTLGFQELQKSIWVSPYDVSKEIEKVVRNHSLDSYIKIFLIEEIPI